MTRALLSPYMLAILLVLPAGAEECLSIEGPVIRVSAIKQYTETAQVPLPDRVLTPTPEPGRRRWITTENLREWGLTPVAGLSGPGICVQRRLTQISHEDAKRAVDAALPAVDSTARSVSITSIQPDRAPQGDLDLRPAGFRLLSSNGGYCSFLWDGSFAFDGTRRLAVKVLGRYQAEVVRLAARHELRAGDVLTPSDYDRVVEPGCPMGAERKLAADGGVMRHSVAKGESITASMLQSPALVEEGGVVSVVAQAGGASVRIHAIAERTGRRGESIMVRNTENGKRIRVVITGAGEARATVTGAGR